jgi:arabinofuranosyltransferase
MPEPRAAATLLATLPAALVLAFGIAQVWPFFSDDAFISLRYSERLLAGEGLTWTAGERVEGYSNLLHVLLCSGLGGLGIDVVTAARAIGVVASLLALFALARGGHALAHLSEDARPLRRLPVAVPLLAASTQVAGCWTCAGLEGPLVALWTSLAFVGLVRAAASAAPQRWSRRALLRLSLPLLLLGWTRPDGPLWTLAIGTGIALLRLDRGLRTAVAAAFWFGLLPLLGFATQLVFRCLYYGDLVPNTAHVKAEFDPHTWPAGVDYLRAAIASHAGVFAAALCGGLAALWSRRTRAIAALLLLPTFVWCGYLVLIGGDHFPGRRLLHGALAPLALLGGLLPCLLRRWGHLTTGAGLALLLLAAFWNLRAADDAQRAELRAEVWEWRGEQLGRELGRAFHESQPLLAVDAAGAVPFFSRLPALDMLGLCDRTIATTSTPAWIATMRPEIPRPPGHMRGNGRYVMDREPDLMLFSNPPGLPLPVFVSAAEFEDDPRFLRGYRCVLLDLGERELRSGQRERLISVPWVRTQGRIGVRDDGQRIEIPAWLFGSHALAAPTIRRHQPPTADLAQAAAAASLAGIAAWFDQRAAVAEVQPTGPWQLRVGAELRLALPLPLPAGRFRCQLVPADAPFTLQATSGGRLDGDLLTSDGGDVGLELATRPDAALPARMIALRLVREF